jgi:hypothetical protein
MNEAFNKIAEGLREAIAEELKPHQLERQLQRLRRKPEGVDGGGDGRPKDAGDMLEALKREHPEMWEAISKK